MDYATARYSADFRRRLEGLCKRKEGVWRPSALHYIRVQVLERLGGVEQLDIKLLCELKHLVEVGRHIFAEHHDRACARSILTALSPEVQSAHDRFFKRTLTSRHALVHVAETLAVEDALTNILRTLELMRLEAGT